MEINYQFKNGNEYAKVPGTSYHDNGKVRKKGVIYLGRVIDKEHHIFCNRERGIFSYDPDTGVFGKALPYRNKDTLRAMVQYYLLCNSANDHAKIWYEGSFASILYPKANEFYKAFDIKCPLYIEQSNGQLITVYHLEKAEQTEL